LTKSWCSSPSGISSRIVCWPGATLRIVEPAVLAVRSIARIAATEVPGRPAYAIPLHAEQLDEPGFVLDLFLQDARRHVVGPRIFAESDVANLVPGADRAALGFEQHFENLRRLVAALLD